jgi:hypothetical protein
MWLSATTGVVRLAAHVNQLGGRVHETVTGPKMERTAGQDSVLAVGLRSRMWIGCKSMVSAAKGGWQSWMATQLLHKGIAASD